MGEVRPPPPATLICGLLAADRALFDAVETPLQEAFGAIGRRSEIWPFDFTDYYEREMGAGLWRRFLAFEGPFDPATLADAKNTTQRIETAFARTDDGGRRLNLDPGYITPHSLILATTKDFPHRIYLRDGIFAEVTRLLTRHGGQSPAGAYADFASGRYDPFLMEVRGRLIERTRRNQSDAGNGSIVSARSRGAIRNGDPSPS